MNNEERFAKIDKRLSDIDLRNKRVEADKAWETSLMRRLVVFVLTYIVIVLIMYFSEISNPFINAIVPAVGFALSTMTLPFIKKIWLKKYVKGIE